MRNLSTTINLSRRSMLRMVTVAAGPVGAMVDIGPAEPFYTTQLTVLRT